MSSTPAATAIVGPWREAMVATLRASAVADAIEIAIDAPLARRTTFGIGGPADLHLTAHSSVAVAAIMKVLPDDVPLFVLGGGSNLLVGDRGIRGVVLSLGGDLAELRVEDNGKTLIAGCGCTFPRLTKTALELGWPGAVGWMGTPGQVGGAILMNAGSRWGEVGDDVSEVEVVDGDRAISIPRSACDFAYRSSRFQRGTDHRVDSSITSADQKLRRLVLTRVILRCEKSQPENASELRDRAHELLKRRHQTQPKVRSAGSLFKNPPGDFAGRLIEAAGLKGYSVGQAQISPVHANFVVNNGGASAADVVAVANHAVATVRAQSGVQLEWEVRRVGDFGDIVVDVGSTNGTGVAP